MFGLPDPDCLRYSHMATLKSSGGGSLLRFSNASAIGSHSLAHSNPVPLVELEQIVRVIVLFGSTGVLIRFVSITYWAVAATTVTLVVPLTIGCGLQKSIDKGFSWVQGVLGRLIYAQYSDVQYTYADSGSKSHRQRQRRVLAVFGDTYNAQPQKCNPLPCSLFCAATGGVLSTRGNSVSTRFFYRSSSGGVLRFFALGRL